MVRSKKTVLRVRQELDNYILERGRPLRTLPIPHVNNGVRTAATGKGTGQVLGVDNDTRIPIDQDIANALKLYATTLCKYLVGNGIPAVVGYDSGPDRRTSSSIIVSDGGRAWYISHYVLDISIGSTNGVVYVPCICLGMSTDQYVTNHYAMTTKYLGGMVNATDLDYLVEYLQRTIDTIKGNLLCSGCHYSSRDENLRCCGRGLVSTSECSGYHSRKD